MRHGAPQELRWQLRGRFSIADGDGLLPSAARLRRPYDDPAGGVTAIGEQLISSNAPRVVESADFVPGRPRLEILPGAPRLEILLGGPRLDMRRRLVVRAASAEGASSLAVPIMPDMLGAPEGTPGSAKGVRVVKELTRVSGGGLPAGSHPTITARIGAPLSQAYFHAGATSSGIFVDVAPAS